MNFTRRKPAPSTAPAHAAPAGALPVPPPKSGHARYAQGAESRNTKQSPFHSDASGLGIGMSQTDAERRHNEKTRQSGAVKENLREVGSKAITKMLSFPWNKTEKRTGMAVFVSTPISSPTFIKSSGPIPSSSLPLGFPRPPTTTSPRIHASSSIAPHHATPMTRRKAVPTSESTHTMSTTASSFSLASTNLFTDEWESSSATDLTSSPDNSPQNSRKGSPKENVMWVVKGFPESPLRADISNAVYGGLAEEEDSPRVEMLARSMRRNSTPIPHSVAAMLADPETPPRNQRRSSTSSTPASRSPATRRPRSTAFDAPGSPDSPGDADDEISPARVTKRPMVDLFASERPLSSRTRIPSIRFEGISMDAVFAEVERKMADDSARDSTMRDVFGTEELAMEKRARRRTKVFSVYRPLSFDATSSSVSVNSEASCNTARPPSVASTTITEQDEPEEPEPIRCEPVRRASPRPSPLNIVAANASTTRNPEIGPRTQSATVPESPYSPPLSGAFPLAISRNSGGIFSPRIDGSFSPAPASPGLGEAFAPSPALSSTSTFRGIELPEVNVVPPTPVDDGGEWSAPKDYTEGGVRSTKVVLLERRTVRVSTRASTSGSRRGERKAVPAIGDIETSTPPLSPAFSVTSFSSATAETPSPTTTTFPPQPTLDKPSPLSRTAFEAEEEGSENEDAFAHMLSNLNRPHTPPPSIIVTSSTSISLTRRALDFHALSSTPPSVKAGNDSDSSSTRYGDAVPNRGLALANSTNTYSTRPLVIAPVAASKSRVVVRVSNSSETLSSSDGATDSEESGYESFEGAEMGVVMMGERVETGYEIGRAI